MSERIDIDPQESVEDMIEPNGTDDEEDGGSETSGSAEA